MSVLDTALHVGVETTYGTGVAPTRSFEASDDGLKRNMMPLQHVGFRAGQHGMLTGRQRMINGGGSGTVTVPLLDHGMGMLLRGMAGTVTGPAVQGATAAYLQTYATDDEEPAASYTMQMVRSLVDATTTQPFTYKGCVITGWTLNQDQAGLPNLALDVDFQDVDTTTAAATPSYPTADMYAWDQCTVTLNGSALEPRSLSLTCDLKMDYDRRLLRGSALKKRPRRNGLIDITGQMELDFTGINRYDEFANGTQATNLVIKYTGPNIASTFDYFLTFTMPVIVWENEGTPEASTDALTAQPLNFRVLHNVTNPMLTITYESTDTTA